MAKICCENENRVLVIALDGGTYRVLHPFIEAGELSNIGGLMQRGYWGGLNSTIPAISPTAWASFITGKNPGKHGIFSFLNFDSSAYNTKSYEAGMGYPVNALSIPGYTLWDLIGVAGKRVGIINVPLTYPPKRVNGFMITSFLTPPGSSNFTYPPELVDRLDDYRIDIDHGVGGFGDPKLDTPDDYERFLDDLHEVLIQRGNTTIKLMREQEWDFFMVCFNETDRLHHYFWHGLAPDHPLHAKAETQKYVPKAKEIYRQLDAFIGKLLEQIDKNTTVILLSDHGFHASAVYRVHINNWLMKQGLLHLHESNSRRMLLSIRQALAKIKLMPHLRKLLPKQTVDNTAQSILDDCVDWTKTQAWSIGLFANTGGIWINLKGEREMGVVQADTEYENLRDYLMKEMKTLRTPKDEKPIVSKIFKKEDIYFGTRLKYAPDLIYILHPEYTATTTLQEDIVNVKLITPNPDPFVTGNHEQDGILMIAGPNVRQGKFEFIPSIESVTPTILYLLGIPIPQDMDGKVITDAILPEYMSEHPITYQEAPMDIENGSKTPKETWESPEEIEKVKERLRALGYLD